MAFWKSVMSLVPHGMKLAPGPASQQLLPQVAAGGYKMAAGGYKMAAAWKVPHVLLLILSATISPL